MIRGVLPRGILFESQHKSYEVVGTAVFFRSVYGEHYLWLGSEAVYQFSNLPAKFAVTKFDRVVVQDDPDLNVVQGGLMVLHT